MNVPFEKIPNEPLSSIWIAIRPSLSLICLSKTQRTDCSGFPAKGNNQPTQLIRREEVMMNRSDSNRKMTAAWIPAFLRRVPGPMITVPRTFHGELFGVFCSKPMYTYIFKYLNEWISLWEVVPTFCCWAKSLPKMLSPTNNTPTKNLIWSVSKNHRRRYQQGGHATFRAWGQPQRTKPGFGILHSKFSPLPPKETVSNVRLSFPIQSKNLVVCFELYNFGTKPNKIFYNTVYIQSSYSTCWCNSCNQYRYQSLLISIHPSVHHHSLSGMGL